jgi:hypothetical protein
MHSRRGARSKSWQVSEVEALGIAVYRSASLSARRSREKNL